MPKRSDISIDIRLPKNHKAVKASIKLSTGKLVFLDDQGVEVAPEYMERTIQYNRPKGPKVQSNQKVVGELCTVTGLSELAQYDAIIGIDTNTVKIGGSTVSVACFFKCRLIPDGDIFRVECDEKLNIYEFHNVAGNPELLAILKVARDIIQTSLDYSEKTRIAFVTDTELGLHDGINSQSVPIYGQYYLPKQFRLLYASADTGKEFINGLIRFCDKQARSHIKKLRKGKIPDFKLMSLDDMGGVKYRYMFWDVDVSGVDNWEISGVKFQEGSEITLYKKIE